MGVSTLHASNIKGFAFEFARTSSVDWAKHVRARRQDWVHCGARRDKVYIDKWMGVPARLSPPFVGGGVVVFARNLGFALFWWSSNFLINGHVREKRIFALHTCTPRA